jgi:hypothetical protein
MAIEFLLSQNDIKCVLAWDGISTFINGSEWFSPSTSTKYIFYKDEDGFIRWYEMIKDGTPIK